MKGILVIIGFILSFFFAGEATLPKTITVPDLVFLTPTVSPTPLPPSYGKVKRIIDGDTIELETGEVIRYIGIDTPEVRHPTKRVQCFGREASQKNKELVEGKIVRLEKDVSENDQYKRLLRYVYIENEATTSGILINELLVKEGYAYASTFPPDVKYADYFTKLQNEARSEKRGLWKTCV